MPGGVYDSRMPEAHYDVIKPKVSQLLNILCASVLLSYHYQLVYKSALSFLQYYICNVRLFNMIIYHPVPCYRVTSSDS